MMRFILVTFGFLALVFYQMSGGADFDPVAAREAAMMARAAEEQREPPTDAAPQVATAVATEPEPETAKAEVSRIALNLTSLDEVLDTPAPEPEAPTLPAAELVPVAAGAPASTASETSVILPSIIFPGSTTAASSAAVAPPRDIRSVSGDLVNMRGGPGTDFAVIGQLRRGTDVEVLQDAGTGWVQLRPVEGGPAGWIADFLLSSG